MWNITRYESNFSMFSPSEWRPLYIRDRFHSPSGRCWHFIALVNLDINSTHVSPTVSQQPGMQGYVDPCVAMTTTLAPAYPGPTPATCVMSSFPPPPSYCNQPPPSYEQVFSGAEKKSHTQPSQWGAAHTHTLPVVCLCSGRLFLARPQSRRLIGGATKRTESWWDEEEMDFSARQRFEEPVRMGSAEDSGSFRCVCECARENSCLEATLDLQENRCSRTIPTPSRTQEPQKQGVSYCRHSDPHHAFELLLCSNPHAFMGQETL